MVAVAVIAVLAFQSRDPDLGRAVPELGALHSPPYEYNTNPPTSGNHLSTPGRYGFWGETLIPEQVVHNMEHGAVVIWYEPDNPALAGSVNQLVRDIGPRCLIAGEHEGMEYPLVATAWGRMFELESYDEGRLREFIGSYQGENGPESGLCWDESLVPGVMNR